MHLFLLSPKHQAFSHNQGIRINGTMIWSLIISYHFLSLVDCSMKIFFYFINWRWRGKNSNITFIIFNQKNVWNIHLATFPYFPSKWICKYIITHGNIRQAFFRRRRTLFSRNMLAWRMLFDLRSWRFCCLKHPYSRVT